MTDRKKCPQSPFLGPITLPEDAFEELEPTTWPDGSKRRRFRIKALGPEGPILHETRSELIHNEITEIKPMNLPVGLVFYLNYTYGAKKSDDQ